MGDVCLACSISMHVRISRYTTNRINKSAKCRRCGMPEGTHRIWKDVHQRQHTTRRSNAAQETSCREVAWHDLPPCLPSFLPSSQAPGFYKKAMVVVVLTPLQYDRQHTILHPDFPVSAEATAKLLGTHKLSATTPPLPVHTGSIPIRPTPTGVATQPMIGMSWIRREVT